MKAIKRITKDVPASKIAADLQCNPLTVRAWKKNQQSIKDLITTNTNAILKKKVHFRKIETNQVDKATWIWFQQYRSKGMHLSGPLIRAQALKFHQILRRSTNFQASEGWLSKWKNRHNIRNVSISGEKLSANETAAEKYKAIFIDMVTKERLTADQVFNCDETGLYYKMLPQKTLSATTENGVSGMKGNKDHVTIMACSNASGSLKLPLMVIGKFAKPSSLKNITVLPVYYKSQSNSWMTGNLFESWFYEEFVPKVNKFLIEKKLPLKAVLLMDNCHAHLNTLRQGDIKTIFLPLNTTSFIQPIDQGMLKCLKINYRKKLMFSLLDDINNGGNLIKYLKSISIKDVIFQVATAWDELPALTIAKSWNQLWPKKGYIRKSTDNTQPMEEPTANDNIIKTYRSEIQQFYHLLMEIENYQDVTIPDINKWLISPMQEIELLNDKEIVDMISNKENNDDFFDTKIDSSVMSEIVSSNQAKNAINTIIQYCNQNKNYSKDDILTLHRIKDSIIYKAVQSNTVIHIM